MATIRSIAEDLNLSAATVSRALRGSGGVNAVTREKVRSAAERLGYLRTRSVEAGPKTIAVLVRANSKTDMYELARRYILVINEEFARRGWRLHPVFVSEDEAAAEETLTEVGPVMPGVTGRLDGCLVIGRLPGQVPQRMHAVLAERFDNNIVMVCRHDVLNGLSGVASMDYAGGVQAAQVLVEAGHRRVGWIGSLGSRDLASERLGGVLTTLRACGGDLAAELWLNDREMLPRSAVGEALAEALPADRTDWPTAWVCSTDWLAAKLIVWARGEGFDVPRDVSVVAFDNTRVAEELAEAVITSVVFPYEQIGRKSVELLDLLLNSPVADAIVWSLPSRLRVGATVARVS